MKSVGDVLTGQRKLNAKKLWAGKTVVTQQNLFMKKILTYNSTGEGNMLEFLIILSQQLTNLVGRKMRKGPCLIWVSVNISESFLYQELICLGRWVGGGGVTRNGIYDSSTTILISLTL